MKRCGNCGAMMDDDSLFCPECGVKQEEQPPYGQEQPPYGQEDWKPYKKRGGGVVVVCVFLLISLLIVGGIGFGIYRLIHPAREIVAEYDYDSGEDSSSSEPAYTEEEEETEDAGETRDYNDSEDEWSDDTDDGDDLARGSVNAKAASEYVIPYSNQRLLGDSDVAGLSLREINYAKNEIYARHGRKFDSQELQNYFNSKSWYYGTIEPENFDVSLLTDVEKKNAEFLSDVEFSISANGYQLDQ